MPYCEMCGTEEESLTTIKTSHTELDVCSNCKSVGTVVDEANESEEEEGQTEQDEGVVSPESMPSSVTSSTNSGAGRPSMDVTQIRTDYGEVIQNARETYPLTIAELAEKVGERESHIRKIEQGERKPTEDLQRELEQVLGITLTAAQTDYETEKSGDESEQTTISEKTEFDI